MSLRKSDQKIDMTRGPIMRNILMLALPLVLGNILQQLYTTVDTLVIGRYCGTVSLAAVGTSAQPVEALLCVFLGIGTGVSILVSQHIGAGNALKTREVCNTAVMFVWTCGIPLGVLGYFLAPLILRLMQVPEDAAPAAAAYTRIVLAGSLGNIGYNMNAGILRGLGNSRASLWFLTVSCVTNIMLDLFLVAGMGMDVSGAALATAVSMFVSWMVSIRYIQKHFPELSFPVFTRRFSSEQLKRIVSIGLPIGLNNSLYSVGHIALQTLVNAQGSLFIAGQSVAGRITGLANIAISGMSSAATTFSGQNFGAGNHERLRKGSLRIPIWTGIVTMAMGLVWMLPRGLILRVFSSDETVLMYADRYVVIMLLSIWIFGVFNSMLCMVNGVGEVRYTTVVNLLMLWAVRIPCAHLISRLIGGTWIMLSFPVSFMFGLLCMAGYYLFSKKWRAIIQNISGTSGNG